MKTKPFNLEQALAGAKVVTRCGEEVSQLTLFKVKQKHCLLGAVKEALLFWTIEGYCFNEDSLHDYDLFLSVETKKVYVNIFEGKNGLFVAPQYFKDKKTAIINKNNFEGLKVTYIKTIEITDEP